MTPKSNKLVFNSKWAHSGADRNGYERVTQPWQSKQRTEPRRKRKTGILYPAGAAVKAGGVTSRK